MSETILQRLSNIESEIIELKLQKDCQFKHSEKRKRLNGIIGTDYIQIELDKIKTVVGMQ